MYICLASFFMLFPPITIKIGERLILVPRMDIPHGVDGLIEKH